MRTNPTQHLENEPLNTPEVEVRGPTALLAYTLASAFVEQAPDPTYTRPTIERRPSPALANSDFFRISNENFSRRTLGGELLACSCQLVKVDDIDST